MLPLICRTLSMTSVESRFDDFVNDQNQRKLNQQNYNDGSECTHQSWGWALSQMITQNLEINEGRINLIHRAQHDANVKYLMAVKEVIAKTSFETLWKFTGKKEAADQKPKNLLNVQGNAVVAIHAINATHVETMSYWRYKHNIYAGNRNHLP